MKLASSVWLRGLFHTPRNVLLFLVKSYRLLLSPTLGSCCRFAPSCSAYALQALQCHGAGLGSYLTVRRLLRCGPWCEGGHDPVPAQIKLFSSLVTPVTSPSSTKKPS